MPAARSVIGLVPAAGRSLRLAPLPCSKEIFPVGFRSLDGGERRPKVACHYLLERFGAARVERALIVLRAGKWDVPAYLLDGGLSGVALAYLVVDATPGPPFTLDRAFPFVRDQTIAFGFPDIIFEPHDTYVRLLDRLDASGADVVLALFPAHRSAVLDMVRAEPGGRVRELLIKPARTELRHTWMCAVWSPVFTRFLHEQLPTLGAAGGELSLGHVLSAALAQDLVVDSVTFPDGSYLDIGTPEDLARAVRTYAQG